MVTITRLLSLSLSDKLDLINVEFQIDSSSRLRVLLVVAYICKSYKMMNVTVAISFKCKWLPIDSCIPHMVISKRIWRRFFFSRFLQTHGQMDISESVISDVSKNKIFPFFISARVCHTLRTESIIYDIANPNLTIFESYSNDTQIRLLRYTNQIIIRTNCG